MFTGSSQGLQPPTAGPAHALHAQIIGLVELLVGTLVHRCVPAVGAAPITGNGRRVRPLGRLLRGLGRGHTSTTAQVVGRLLSAALFG